MRKIIRLKICWLFTWLGLNISPPIQAQPEIPSVLIRPIFVGHYTCTEHWAGQLQALGDALGTDCWPQRLIEVAGRTWMRSYQNQGLANQDWYGWEQAVIAPFDAEVYLIHLNPEENQPGVMGKGPASYLILKREDGLMLMLAHIRHPQVQLKESVKTGQIIAKVGNNGQSRHPHIHLGAWKDKIPYQIRFDQRYITQF